MLRGSGRLWTAALVGVAGACAGTTAAMDQLPRAVAAYNDMLRWGKLDGAAAFRLPEEQAAFVARYAAAEDDLHIESIEVRSVAFPKPPEGTPLCADVTVVAQAYLLPSTVVAKTVIVQRWEHRDGAWRLVHADRELAPPLPAPAAPPANPVEPGLGGDDAEGPSAAAETRR